MFELYNATFNILINKNTLPETKIQQLKASFSSYSEIKLDEASPIYYLQTAEGKIPASNLKDKNGRTLLSVCAMQGETEVALWLLEQQKATVDLPDAHGLTPLCYAARNNQVKMLELLIDKKANVYYSSEFSTDAPTVGRLAARTTPMHIAVKFGNVEAVQCLLPYAPFYLHNSIGENPVDLAKNLLIANERYRYNRSSIWSSPQFSDNPSTSKLCDILKILEKGKIYKNSQYCG